MNNVFFGSEGITITSANHLANLAKESVRQLEQELRDFSFVDEKISLLITSTQARQTKIGLQKVDDIEPKLRRIGHMNAFIAWAREAIKEKEEQTELLRLGGFDAWHKKIYGDVPELPRKQSKDYKQEVLNEMSIKDLNEYYQLEAEVAVIGKFIHPNGPYSVAREDLLKKMSNPISTTLSGSDTIVREYSPSIGLVEVDGLFFQLQSKHRELNAQLNQIKYAIDQKVLEKDMADRSKYESELNEFIKQRDLRMNEFEKFKTSELERIKKLKVVIPDAHKEVFEYLKELGK